MEEKDYKEMGKIIKKLRDIAIANKLSNVTTACDDIATNLAGYLDKLDGIDLINWGKYGGKIQFIKDSGVQ